MAASNYGTNLAQAFAAAPVKIFYERSVSDDIFNRDYEGEIKDKATIVNILTFSALDWQTYTSSALSSVPITEVKGQLQTNQEYAYYFKIQDIQQLQSWIKEPQGTVIEQLGMRLKEKVDNYMLGQYADVAAGQRIGTNVTTGTVAIDVNGNVTGSGTSFVSAMVGRGFQAAGQAVWYRVLSVASGTSMVIVNDTNDDPASGTYTGGVISAGATFTVEAVTPVALTPSNVDSYVIKARGLLKKAKVWDVSQPWLVLSTDVADCLLQSGNFTPYTPQSFEDVTKKGIVDMYRGFKVYESQQVNGNDTSGWHCLAGITAWKTMAEALVKAEEEPFLTGDFGKGYKGLFVYGQKTVDIRRNCAVELFATA